MKFKNIKNTVAIIGVASSMLLAASCNKFLDVNKNQNSATSSTPEAVFPSTQVALASSLVTYNDYGGWLTGYEANSNGYGGWGSALTYNFDNNTYTGLWSSTYDILNDIQYVIDQTEGKDVYSYYNGAAKILKAYNFQLLVDQYNDVPYDEALKGLNKLTPAYTKAETIYLNLYNLLDSAVDIINKAERPYRFNTDNVIGKADVTFSESMTNWIKLANTLKLKLLVRASKTTVFSGITPKFDAAGFLTDDAIVNPGYVKDNGKQNPFWNTYYSSYANAYAGWGRSRIAASYVISFYNGQKLTDTKRANAIYRSGISTRQNQLGNISDDAQQYWTTNPVWYSGPTYALSADDGERSIGVLKGRAAGVPIFTSAESYFLQSEAVLKGIISGDATTLFNKGIEESFHYLYKSTSNAISATNALGYTDYVADASAYRTTNATNYLANLDIATTTEQKLEAIITQKYIALNMINGQEAWAEYRRTGYPKIDNTTPLGAFRTFVSLLSQATTVDRLPGRILYPNSEYQLNSANMPTGITVYGSYVFWDRRK